MSDNLEPRPGDVWESPDGTHIFINQHRNGLIATFETGGVVSESLINWSLYTLRFRDGKPVPQPQPDGETVTKAIDRFGERIASAIIAARSSDTFEVAAALSKLLVMAGVVPETKPESVTGQ